MKIIADPEARSYWISLPTDSKFHCSETLMCYWFWNSISESNSILFNSKSYDPVSIINNIWYDCIAVAARALRDFARQLALSIINRWIDLFKFISQFWFMFIWSFTEVFIFSNHATFFVIINIRWTITVWSHPMICGWERICLYSENSRQHGNGLSFNRKSVNPRANVYMYRKQYADH